MTALGRVLFGQVTFRESEEYLEFQYKFLAVVMLGGAVLTALILATHELGANPIADDHVRSMRLFTAAALFLWVCLRGRKHWFLPVAVAYEVVCLLEYLSALIYVPEDQLRIFWFVINVPGVFLLLGQRAGWLVTIASVILVAIANRHIEPPYSTNAIVTYSFGMVYFALFFQVYASRSISYFSRMRDYNKKLHQMATHDMLTGVLNARAYYEICDQMIHLAQRDNSSYCVLFVDLDHFKSINDIHGHAAGDAVLKAVAACLSKNLRKSDALGRIGGEEFSIFLPNTDLAGASALAETIRKGIEELMPSIGGRRLTITASLGVARSQRGDQSMQEIQRQADQAMYAAKALGRNRVSSFDELVQQRLPMAA